MARNTQLRFASRLLLCRLRATGVVARRAYSTTPPLFNNHVPLSSSAPAASDQESTAEVQQEEPRLQMSFTCTVEGCSTRSTHTFTKRSYESGIVLIQCPGCQNRHLIADHIGWFKESTEDGKLRTVEDLLRVRGERIRKGRLEAGGAVEYTED